MRIIRQLQLVLAIATYVEAGVIFPSRLLDIEALKPSHTSTTSPSPTLLNRPIATTLPINSTNRITQASTTQASGLSPSASAAVFANTEPKWFLYDDDVPSGVGNLPQAATNGDSPLGLLNSPRLKHHIGNNAVKGLFPWGNKTANSSDPHNIPDTGMVRRYTLSIERGSLAPDGVSRPVILANGQFPGPTIEANWGDWFEITVINNIKGPEEGTAMHWHGILQKDMPWEDGVPGITQCPIAPGDSFTYRFRADLYGSSWYHAHYSAQYAAGVFGAMVIHGPTDNAKYDVDLGPVLISDYYHDSYFDLVESTMSTNVKDLIVFSDNNLINGKGIFNCTFARNPGSCDPNAGLSKFHFDSGKAHRLRLINAGAEGLQKFSIDGHRMKVIAYDFVPIVPYETEIVTLHVGQRADVIVVADGEPDGIYWMRSTMGRCSNTYQPNALAMIYYDNANYDDKPTSQAWPDNTDPCANDDLSATVPYYAMDAATDPDTELEVDIRFGKNATGHYVWTMNNSTFRTNFNYPVLPLLQQGESADTFPSEWNIYDVGKSKSTRITINNYSPVSHPMHLHGHNMFVLSSSSNIPSSEGSPNSRSRSSESDDDSGPLLNLSNPTRRDTHILPPNGQIVIQFEGGNSGVWPLHCHVAWHVSGGLYMSILQDAEGIRNMDMGTSAEKNKALCKNWRNFTDNLSLKGESVDMIDSGLRMMEKEK